MTNDPETERDAAATEQRLITERRLRHMLCLGTGSTMTRVSTHVLDLRDGRSGVGDHGSAGAARLPMGTTWWARR